VQKIKYKKCKRETYHNQSNLNDNIYFFIFFNFILQVHMIFYLQCFDTVGWASGGASGLYKLCWCGYLSGAMCRLFAYGPANATAIPKPHHLLLHLNPDWFSLSGTGLPRLSGNEAFKWV